MLKRRLHCNTRLVISIPKSLTYFKVRKVKSENERNCYTPQVCIIIFLTIWTIIDVIFLSNIKFCLFYDCNLTYFCSQRIIQIFLVIEYSFISIEVNRWEGQVSYLLSTYKMAKSYSDTYHFAVIQQRVEIKGKI